MEQFLQVTFSGLATGAVFAIAAVGFALLWQTAGAINFAHGEFIVLPAVVMLVLTQQPVIGIPDFIPLIGGTQLVGPIPQLGIIAAFAITVPLMIFLLGYVFKRTMVDQLLEPGGDDIPLVIATLGLALVMREYLRISFGAAPQRFPSPFGNHVWNVGGVAITAIDVGVLVVATVVIIGLQFFLNRTYTGRQMQATAQNQETARVLGDSGESDGLLHLRHQRSAGHCCRLARGPGHDSAIRRRHLSRSGGVHRGDHRGLQPGEGSTVRWVPGRVSSRTGRAPICPAPTGSSSPSS